MEVHNSYFDLSIPKSILDYRSIPIATRCLTGAYVVLTIALFALRCATYYSSNTAEVSIPFSSIQNPVLQLIPSDIFMYPYSIVLSNLIDTNVCRFVLNLANLLIGGTFIERNWNSSNEMFKFTLGIGSLTNLLVMLVTVVAHFFIPDMVDLHIPLDGNYSVLIGFPIIYKQLLPETTIININKPSFISKNFRFKLLPILVLSFMTVTQLVIFRHFSNILSIWVTFMSCWVYLRFFQTLPASATGGRSDYYTPVVGDASDTFQLIYFFPDIIKPVLRPVFDKVYDIVCVKHHWIQPFQVTDVDKGNDIAEQRGAKKIAPDVQDRRRQLALDVLQERMV